MSSRRSSRPELRHGHPEDRNVAPLRPRRELFEAMFAYAVHVSARRRRKQGRPPAPILRVADQGGLWFKKLQWQVLDIYRRHWRYLEVADSISARTLTRHVAGYIAQPVLIRGENVGPRLIVNNRSRWDRNAHRWIQEPNVYVITRAGVLWIKRNARSLRIPLFV